jgi:hypothetical protein
VGCHLTHIEEIISMTASFHHDGRLGPYNLLNSTMFASSKFSKFRPFSKWPPKHKKKPGNVWKTFRNSILLLSYLVYLLIRSILFTTINKVEIENCNIMKKKNGCHLTHIEEIISMTTSFHHDGSLGPYILLNSTMFRM